MIDVKGTKTKGQETDPSQVYELKNTEEKSKTPFAFGLFLVGVALYLKAFFPSSASANTQEATPEKGKAAPEDSQLPAMENADTPLDGRPTGSVPVEDSPSGSGGTIVELSPRARFLTIDSPEVPLVQPEVSITWGDFNPFGFDPNAANDNDGGPITTPVDIPRTPVSPPRIPPTDTNPPGNPANPPGPEGPSNPDITPPIDTDQPCPCDGSDGGPCDDDDDEYPHTANRAPRTSGPVYLMDLTGCGILAIGLLDLLRGAIDPDGDVLSVKNLTVSSGVLTQSGEKWIFQNESQLIGPVTISYQITDGEFTIMQTAHFNVVRSYIEGTAGDDTLLGTMCSDDIEGGAGDDNIDGRAGDDVISGGKGDDHIVAGAGNDTVWGGAGRDIIFGGLGNDHLSGGAGDDRLYGEEGDDILFGDAGNDYLSGGPGRDFLSGGDGNDTIRGDGGNDTLWGGAGDDYLDGGLGHDVLSDGGGKDVVLGGDGDDHFIAALDRDNDVYSGGDGTDTLDYSAAASDLSINLAQGTVYGAETGTDTVSSFEVALGGSGNDRIIGGAASEHLIGNAGDDVISDGQGADIVLGGAGDDHVIVTPDCDDDVYDGGEGCDTLDFSNTSEGVWIDFVSGQATGAEIGNDTISNFETAVGGTGDDHFIIGSEPVTLTGDEGEDLFEFTPPSSEAQTTPVLHEILDFKVGDRIRMSKYDIFEKVFDKLEDRFENIYGDDIDDDDIAIRYRHDRTDEIDRTIIEADFNDDDIYETTIYLQGYHALVIVEQV